MGLKTGGTGSTYLRFKDGKFFRSSDKETLFTEVEGWITSLNIVEEEYEGRPIKKLILKISDEQEDFILGLNFDSSYCSNMIGFMKNADLSKKLSLVGTFKEDESGKKVGILIKQDGSFMKKFYTRDEPNGLPGMKEVIVNKKKVWDKSDHQDFLENVVLNELAPTVFSGKIDKQPLKELTTVKDDFEEEDDLPF